MSTPCADFDVPLPPQLICQIIKHSAMQPLLLAQQFLIDNYKVICCKEGDAGFYVRFDNDEEKYQMTLVEAIGDFRFEFEDIHTPDVLRKRESFFSEYFKSMCQ